SLSTITNALFVSGGITNVGSLRNIQLRRQGQTVAELDLYDLLLAGDTSADQRLQPDDVLFIPPIGDTVGVAGEVIRPAIYELRDEETVLEAVMLAGGTLPTAFHQASRIERIDVDGSRTLIDIDVSSPTGQVVPIVNGDVIQIYSILDQLENVVLTEGHLRRPGGFQWREGMRVSDVIPSLSVLLPNPDTEYALIVREIPPTSTLQVLRVELAAALAVPGSDADLLLQPRDRVITFAANGDRQAALASLISELNAQARFERPAQVVSVQGNVGFPGSYPLLQGMTIGDLIESASGLLENTDTQFALLVRRRDSRGTIEALNAIDASGRNIDFDRILQAGDQLYVFNTFGNRAALIAGGGGYLPAGQSVRMVLE
ncbi:MAG: SLBB domain-containing protein, partial [Gammaproteobacteria bacterium]